MQHCYHYDTVHFIIYNTDSKSSGYYSTVESTKNKYGWWDVLLSLYYKFTAKSNSERILKIGQYLAKLEAKNIEASLAYLPNKL